MPGKYLIKEVLASFEEWQLISLAYRFCGKYFCNKQQNECTLILNKE